ncbi:hypothetical protein ACHWQZ_G012227 [Mnemiopsis leidyi]
MALPSKGYPVSFQLEISHLMTRAGDLFKPCAASCSLIEKELLTELEDLAHRLIGSAGMRSSTIIEPDDFAFHMRQNASKLYRLNEFLTKRSLLRNKLSRKFDEEEVSVHPDLELDIVNKPWKRRKVTKKQHFKILESTNSPSLLFLGSYDSLSWLRMHRGDQISEAMSGLEYEEYTTKCQHSFLKDSCEISSYFSKFIPNPYSLSKECAPIIGFLAHEMVQQWVEAASRVYKDMKKIPLCQYCSQSSSGSSTSFSDKGAANKKSGTVSILPCLQPLHFNEVLRRFYNSNSKHSLLIL